MPSIVSEKYDSHDSVRTSFFQLAETPRRSPVQHVAALWPMLVLLVVLFFFAVAGLQR